MKAKTLATVAAAAALLTLASCQSEQLDPTLKGFFPEDIGETRSTERFADAQAAAGARNDATLYKIHFDGPRLNSLGESKLALMLKDDDAAEPMTVYLSVPDKDNLAAGRKNAVLTYLKDAGLADHQVEVVYGDNANTRTPAARYLPHMSKAETGGAASGEDATPGAAPGGGMSASDGGLLGASGAK